MTLREIPFRAPAGRHLGVGLALATVVAWSSSAWARPEFPGIVQTTLKPDLLCPPTCTICHTTPNPVDETTATQLFVNNLSLAGPAGITEESLPDVLLALEQQVCTNPEDRSCPGGMCTKPCDADGDGMGDVEEIRNGRNPNNSTTMPCPEYGCFARVAPTPAKRSLDGTAVLAALGAALVLAGRWRRRRRG